MADLNCVRFSSFSHEVQGAPWDSFHSRNMHTTYFSHLRHHVQYRGEWRKSETRAVGAILLKPPVISGVEPFYPTLFEIT